MSSSQYDDHWLVRPNTIKGLWWVFSIVLALIVLAQSVIYVKGYFGVDGWFGFGAVYGFLSCLAMVLFAKALGYVLKRPEDYYSIDDGTGSVDEPEAKNPGVKADGGSHV